MSALTILALLAAWFAAAVLLGLVIGRCIRGNDAQDRALDETDTTVFPRS
jgi:multisubunit Na+/H+ antiporter MnhF subunit